MKPSYRNKMAAPTKPAGTLIGLLALAVAAAALAIAIVALLRTGDAGATRDADTPPAAQAAPTPGPGSSPASSPAPGSDLGSDPAAADAQAAAPPEASTESRDGPDGGATREAGDQTADTALTAAEDPYTPPAGRPAIPRPGETITEPIPPQRLASLDDGKTPEPGQIIPWTEAAGYLGHEITVEGEVVNTHLLESGSICFLNFHKDFRGRFYIAMFRAAFDDLPDNQKPDTYYLGKTIRVTGLVKPHRGQPQIAVHRLDQIQVVEDDP